MRAKPVESRPAPKSLRNGLSKTAGGKIAKPKKVTLLANGVKKSKPAPSSGGAKKLPPESKPNPKKPKPKDDTPKEDKTNVVKSKAKIVKDLVKKPAVDGKIGSAKVKPIGARTKKVVNSAKEEIVASNEMVRVDEKIVVDDEMVKKKSSPRSKEKSCKSKITTPKKKSLKLKTVSKVLSDKNKKVEIKAEISSVKSSPEVESNGLDTVPLIGSPVSEKQVKSGKPKTKEFKKTANGACLPLPKKGVPKKLTVKKDSVKKSAPKSKPVKTGIQAVKNVLQPKKERKKREKRVESYNNDSSTSDDLPLDALAARQKNGFVIKQELLSSEMPSGKKIKSDSDQNKKEPTKKQKRDTKDSEKSKIKKLEPEAIKKEPEVVKKEPEVIKKESEAIKKEPEVIKKEPEIKTKKVKAEVKEVKEEAPKKVAKKKSAKVKEEVPKKSKVKTEDDEESVEDSKVLEIDDFGPNLLKSMKKEFCESCEDKPDKQSKLQKTKKNLKSVVEKLKPKALKTSLVNKQRSLKKKLTKIKPKVKQVKDDADNGEKAVAKRLQKVVTFNGARRHRVASLNAIAKVHCLYENESRGALNELIHDDLLQMTESEDRNPEQVLKKITQVSKRILRSAPGIRSVGQHWDMNESSSSDSPTSSSSEDEVKISAPEQRKPVKKRRRQNECKMDLKDMVVRKRMASLNASAILAASYSVEKRTSTVSVRSETPPKRKTTSVTTSSSSVTKEVTPAKRKVEVIVTQDTDVTITGVYVDSNSRSARSEYSMKYRISSTSHTQTEAVATETLLHAECDRPSSPTAPPILTELPHQQQPQQQPPQQQQQQQPKTYTPLNALSSMQPPGNPGNPTGSPPARCNSAFSAPPNFPPSGVLTKDPSYIHGYYQPAGPLISSHHVHHTQSVSNMTPDPKHVPPLAEQTPPPTPSRSTSDTTESEVIISSSSSSCPPGPAPCYRYPHPHPPHQSPYPYTYPHSFYPSPPASSNPHQYPPQHSSPHSHSHSPSPYHPDLCYPPSTSPAPHAYFHPHKGPYGPPTPAAVSYRRYVGPAPPQVPPHPQMPPHSQVPPPHPQYYQEHYSSPVAYYSSNPSNPPPPVGQQQMLVPAGSLENYVPPPAPPATHTSADPYSHHGYYPHGYNGTVIAPPCYPHHATRSLAFIDTAYQGCPCPIQPCPKNVHTGPLTGVSKGSLNNSSNTLPPLGLALPKEPPCAGASGPPSPARGSAGMAPPPTSVATARNPLNQQQWSSNSSSSTEHQKPENETGLLTISRVLSDCISNNFSEPRTDLKQEEEIYPVVKEVPTVNLEVQEEKPSNSSSSRKRKRSPEKDNGKVKKLNNQVELKSEEVLKHRIENLTNVPVINNDLSKVPKVSNQGNSFGNCKLLKITKCLKNKFENKVETVKSEVTVSTEPTTREMKKKSRDHIKSRRKSYNLLSHNNLDHLSVDSKKRRKSINSLSTDISLQNVDLIIKNSELISSTIDCHQVAQDLGIVSGRLLETNNNDKNQNLNNKITSLQLALNSNCKKKTCSKVVKSELGIVEPEPLAIVPHTKDKQVHVKKLQHRKSLTNSKGPSKTETCTKPIVPAICKKPTTGVVNNCQELVPISSLKKSLPTLKWSNGWSWEGQPFKAKVYLTNDNPPVVRKCYPAMRHTEGDMISARDCILLKSGPRKIDLPFVAKVSSLWENPDDGEMMVSLLWYYRPEHTEQGRRPEDTVDEIFASRHKDTNSVACIEDKCYVLTFNEYCRYRKSIKRIEDCVYRTNSVVPVPEDGRYPRLNRLPPGRVAPDLVFFCRRVYDFKQKRILKNPC